MSFEQDQDLVQFAFRFLENRGAVLERTGDGFEALLPGPLSQMLGTPEHIQIKNGSGDDTNGMFSISYGSPLLEKMVDAARGQAPILACSLEFDYLKSQGFDRLVKEQFRFYKSMGEVESSAIIKTDYLLVICRYVAQSDEQKEGLLRLAFSYETGALIPRMEEMLSSIVKDFGNPPGPVWKDENLERIVEGIKNQSKGILAEEILSFKESMTRRFRRDAANLEEYYDALKKEMEKSLERPGLSDELIKDRKEKIALLPDELAKKRDDLFKKYSIRLKVEPCGVMFVRTPAVRVLYRVSIGRKRKNLSLTYNPVTRTMDPLVCQGCGRTIWNVHFCDQHHLLCSWCNEQCPLC
ncbi:MAG: hypothetical protein KKG10_11915 [Proteobacteria bacterium]|nr:hypothetical protein [Pseudomonadota bacterium]